MIENSKHGILISITVTANAPRTEIVGPFNSSFKTKVHAPPVDGKANQELVRFFAELMETAKRNVSIHSGETSKNKKILIVNVDEKFIREKMKEFKV